MDALRSDIGKLMVGQTEERTRLTDATKLYVRLLYTSATISVALVAALMTTSVMMLRKALVTLQQQRAHFESEAVHDVLTGLPNLRIS